MDKKYFDEHLHIALHNFITSSLSSPFFNDKDKLDFINMYLSSNLPIPDSIKEHKTYMSGGGTSLSIMTLFNQEKRDRKLDDLLG